MEPSRAKPRAVMARSSAATVRASVSDVRSMISSQAIYRIIFQNRRLRNFLFLKSEDLRLREYNLTRGRILEIDVEELKREYAEMSDEGLLSFDRKDLTDIARPYYDEEVARRGLLPVVAEQPEANPEPNSKEELIPLETYLSIEEADLARTLLQSADIPTYLENELSMGMTGAGGLRLMVPASFAKQAEEILATQVSEEDLIAQAEAADPVDQDRDNDDPS